MQESKEDSVLICFFKTCAKEDRVKSTGSKNLPNGAINESHHASGQSVKNSYHFN